MSRSSHFLGNVGPTLTVLGGWVNNNAIGDIRLVPPVTYPLSLELYYDEALSHKGKKNERK